MKITVQNGSKHGLSRKDVEAIVGLFPASWSRLANSVVLYAGKEPTVHVTYYQKNKTVGLFWPISQPAEISKAVAIEELLLAFSVIAEDGALPARLSASARASLLAQVADLNAACLKVVSSHESA